MRTVTMPEGQVVTAKSAAAALEEFCALVLHDASLQELLQMDRADEFIAAVVELGRQRGFVLAAADVMATMRANGRAMTANWAEN